MGRTISDIKVIDVEKRKIPSKHYVYVIYVTWSDGSTNVIYRRYSRFFDFQSRMIDMFPEESGALDPSKRIIPFLPGKKYFGRSHIREVAQKRMGPIADYCKSIVSLPRRISQCKDVLSFFELDPEDINPPKGKKASVRGSNISNPKPLEVYVACTAYKKQEKGEVSLKVGMQVEIVEKTETGWWFVNVEDEQGWVPSSCLQREDGIQEDTSVRFAEGDEEQYLCTEEFTAEGKDELSLERGAVVHVAEKNLEGWWLVRYNGKEGYVPATYLVKSEVLTDVLKLRKKKIDRPSSGPEIVKSLHDISDLLRDKESSKATSAPNNTVNETDDTEEYVYEFKDDFDDDEKVYTIDEVSKILKADNRGSVETEKVYESIENMKSRSLKRAGRPPPRSVKKGKLKSPVKNEKPPLVHTDSFCVEFVTVAAFSDAVGDGISFDVDESVKVLEKNENGWWYVEINGREGWAPSSYIQEKRLVKAGRQSPPASPTLRSLPKSDSKDDLAGSDDDAKSNSRRISSSIGGLASALKSKLQAGKGSKSPPAPPRKDFLDDHHSNIRSSVDREQLGLSYGSKAKSENDLLTMGDDEESVIRPKTKPKSSGFRPSIPPPAPPGKIADSQKNSVPVPPALAFKKPLPPKPTAGTKPIPPAPPAKTPVHNKTAADDQKVSDSVSEVPVGLASALKARLEAKDKDQPIKPKSPKSPLATKPALKPKFNDWPKPSETKTDDQPRKVSVAGLASALQANFEARDSGIAKTSEPLQKPKPNVPLKPADKKTDVPNVPSKPKPIIPNKTQTATKPSDIKQSSNVDVPSRKVSDLAGVLKAKFENRDKVNETEPKDASSNIDQRPSIGVASTIAPPGGKPQRPTTPPTFKKPQITIQTNTQTRNSGSPGKNLDPKKYNARPLPPKPGLDSAEDTKPATPVRPTVPGKPKPGGGGGVGSIAEALQAKLGNNADTDKKAIIPPKPNSKVGLNSVSKDPLPERQENYTEIEPPGNENDNVYRAVAAFEGGNEGEIQLTVGQEVVLLDQSDGWWYVSYQGQEGWAPANFLEKVNSWSKPVNVNNNASPVLARKNVYRTCSDFKGEQEGELTVLCGEEVEVLEKEDEGWWFVKYNQNEGWVPSAYLTELK